jgi:hypothetical protein
MSSTMNFFQSQMKSSNVIDEMFPEGSTNMMDLDEVFFFG